jgi:GTP cyclohydrolase I
MDNQVTEKESLIAYKIIEIMNLLDINTNADNAETPVRIAKMLNRELFYARNQHAPTDWKVTTFGNPGGSEEPIHVKDIKFYSTCEHHWLPFFGLCDIEYVPGDNILGLSKFPRIVEHICKQPQVQERLVRDIGELLVDILKPKYLKVVLRDVRHLCVEMRGARQECLTTTKYEYKKGGNYNDSK